VPAPGTKYINIWAGSKRIQEAIIRFTIANSWIASEGLTSENLRMYRWDGEKWNELETTLISKDGSATNYEAKTEGFSHFAISGIKTSIAGTTPVATSPAVTTTVTIVTPAAPVSGAAPATNLFIILGVIIAIGVIAFLYLRKK